MALGVEEAPAGRVELVAQLGGAALVVGRRRRPAAVGRTSAEAEPSSAPLSSAETSAVRCRAAVSGMDMSFRQPPTGLADGFGTEDPYRSRGCTPGTWFPGSPRD